MADVDLTGLGVALVTPFKRDLKVDYTALERLLVKVTDGGADYIVVLGTTAETPTLSTDEKKEVSKFIRETIGNRLPLVLGIGGNDTLGVVKKIEALDLDGYSAILSVAPYYNKPTQEGIYQHFKTICDASPLSIILYNVPSRTGVNITPQTIRRLAEYSGKICAVKEASGDMEQCEDLVKKAPAGFSVISGNDGDTYSMMKMGGKGVISVLANAFPKEMKTLVTLCRNKKFQEAQSYQQNLSRLINHLFEDGNPSGVKAVLSQMGIIENVLRLPLVPVSKNVEFKLKKETEILLKK